MGRNVSLRNWAEGLSLPDAQRKLEHAEACIANDDHPFWPHWRAIADALNDLLAHRAGRGRPAATRRTDADRTPGMPLVTHDAPTARASRQP